MLFNSYFNDQTYFPSANKRTNGIWIGRKKHASHVPWTIGAVVLFQYIPSKLLLSNGHFNGRTYFERYSSQRKLAQIL